MDEQTVWQNYEQFMVLLVHYPPEVASNVAATGAATGPQGPPGTPA